MKYSRSISFFSFMILFSLGAASQGTEDAEALGGDHVAQDRSEADLKMDEEFQAEDDEFQPEESSLADDEDIVNQIDKLNKDVRGDLEFTAFIYSERGRRNPFSRPGELKAKILTEEEVASGLEGYDIAAFKLSAVLWDVKYPKAIVKASDKDVYVIEEGTKIGRRNGYVAKIREGEIVIVEPSVQTGEGKTTETIYKTQVLKLGR